MDAAMIACDESSACSLGLVNSRGCGVMLAPPLFRAFVSLIVMAGVTSLCDCVHIRVPKHATSHAKIYP